MLDQTKFSSKCNILVACQFCKLGYQFLCPRSGAIAFCVVRVDLTRNDREHGLDGTDDEHQQEIDAWR